jgi:LemA protein
MKAIKILLVLVVLFVGALGMGGCLVYRGYNKSITLDEAVRQQWAQVEVQLQRRFDLIPNLEATVKGLGEQESKIFLGVAEARKAYFSAAQSGTMTDKVEAASGVERALSRLLVLKETYPELKSNEAFLKLQDAIEGTENRLSVERKRFNDAVGALNGYVRSAWGRLCASFAGVKESKYFEAVQDAFSAPKVDFAEPQ